MFFNKKQKSKKGFSVKLLVMVCCIVIPGSYVFAPPQKNNSNSKAFLSKNNSLAKTKCKQDREDLLLDEAVKVASLACIIQNEAKKQADEAKRHADANVVNSKALLEAIRLQDIDKIKSLIAHYPIANYLDDSSICYNLLKQALKKELVIAGEVFCSKKQQSVKINFSAIAQKIFQRKVEDYVSNSCDSYSHEIIKIILDAGVDPNVRSSKGVDTVLMMATAQGDVKTVKMILDKGAKLNDQGCEGKTALEYAFEVICMNQMILPLLQTVEELFRTDNNIDCNDDNDDLEEKIDRISMDKASKRLSNSQAEEAFKNALRADKVLINSDVKKKLELILSVDSALIDGASFYSAKKNVFTLSAEERVCIKKTSIPLLNLRGARGIRSRFEEILKHCMEVKMILAIENGLTGLDQSVIKKLKDEFRNSKNIQDFFDTAHGLINDDQIEKLKVCRKKIAICMYRIMGCFINDSMGCFMDMDDHNNMDEYSLKEIVDEKEFYESYFQTLSSISEKLEVGPGAAVFNLLLDRGADPTIRNNDGETICQIIAKTDCKNFRPFINMLNAAVQRLEITQRLAIAESPAVEQEATKIRFQQPIAQQIIAQQVAVQLEDSNRRLMKKIHGKIAIPLPIDRDQDENDESVVVVHSRYPSSANFPSPVSTWADDWSAVNEEIFLQRYDERNALAEKNWKK